MTLDEQILCLFRQLTDDQQDAFLDLVRIMSVMNESTQEQRKVLHSADGRITT